MRVNDKVKINPEVVKLSNSRSFINQIMKHKFETATVTQLSPLQIQYPDGTIFQVSAQMIEELRPNAAPTQTTACARITKQEVTPPPPLAFTPARRELPSEGAFDKASSDLESKMTLVKRMKDLTFVRRLRIAIISMEPDDPLPYQRRDILEVCDIIDKLASSGKPAPQANKA